MGRSGWIFESRTAGKHLSDRIEKILRDELGNPSVRKQILEKLYDVLFKSPETRSAMGVARLLLSAGEELTDEFAEALVECALENRRDSDFREWIIGLTSAPDTGRRIKPRLTRGLTRASLEGNGYERDTASRFLEELAVVGDPLQLSRSDGVDRDSDGRAKAQTDGQSTAEDVPVALANDLWLDTEQEGDRIWRAAEAFLTAGLTAMAGLPRALVRVGLASNSHREIATRFIRELNSRPEHSMTMRAALLDAIESENGVIAAAAGCLLVDAGDAAGKGRVGRIVKAVLRDPKQTSETIPRLRALLQGEQSKEAVEAISEYLGRDDADEKVSGSAARLLAEEGHFDASNLAEGLIQGGLSESTLREDVIPHIMKMLDDPALVAKAREALSKALDSGKENLVWGAVQCLWSAGMRFDPGLISAISKEGLESKNEARVQEASRMLEVLIKEPITAPSTIGVLRDRISSLLAWREKPYVKAWPAAKCLLQAGVFSDQNLPRVLVNGGVKGNERLDEVIALAARGISGSQQFGEAVEEELWTGISEDKDAWRAVEVLNALFRTSISDSLKNGSERMQALIRVLVHNGEDHPSVRSLLAAVMEDTERRSYVKESLVSLLGDKESSVAYEAANLLVEQDDYEHVMLPQAIIRGGLGNDVEAQKAMRVLDHIRAAPTMSLPLRAALNEALWSSDSQMAWNAAIYLIERYDRYSPGIARALVRGGFSHDWRGPGARAQKRVRSLLADLSTREATEEGLLSCLFVPEEGHRFNFEVVSLLLSSSFDMSEVVALIPGEQLRWLAVPALALVALSGRIDECRNAASRLGSLKLLAMLGPKDDEVG